VARSQKLSWLGVDMGNPPWTRSIANGTQIVRGF